LVPSGEATIDHTTLFSVWLKPVSSAPVVWLKAAR
jgi:hypothetical protein